VWLLGQTQKFFPLFIVAFTNYSYSPLKGSQSINKLFCVVSYLDWEGYLLLGFKDRSGSKFFDLGRVSHLWFGFGKFALKIPNVSIFFPLGQKNLFRSGQKVPMSKTGQPLFYCGSKVCSGLVGSGPISTRFTYLFLHSLTLTLSRAGSTTTEYWPQQSSFVYFSSYRWCINTWITGAYISFANFPTVPQQSAEVFF